MNTIKTTLTAIALGAALGAAGGTNASTLEAQEHQLLSCQIDAEKAYPLAANEDPADKWSLLQRAPAGSSPPLEMRPRTALLHECMKLHGYETTVGDDRCTITPLLGPDTTAINPYCYQPDGWLWKAVFRLETDAHFCGGRINPFTGEHDTAPDAQQKIGYWCALPYQKVP